MRKISLLIFLSITLCFLSACGDNPDELMGTWRVTTDNPMANLGLQLLNDGQRAYIIMEKERITFKIGNETETLGVKYRKVSRNNWEILYDDGTIQLLQKVGNTFQIQEDGFITIILTREN
ncbi:MAG: hypothetical protein LBE38_00255 [Deltaproteobacteria bacterium]|jgi:hypothetical protein|nr:hypothetical protein [Deltaproteobacteria bacterium]